MGFNCLKARATPQTPLTPLTEKGLSFKKSTLLDKRRKLNSWLLRLSGAVEDLIYSSKNQVAVEEEMAQFNFLFQGVAAGTSRVPIFAE